MSAASRPRAGTDYTGFGPVATEAGRSHDNGGESSSRQRLGTQYSGFECAAPPDTFEGESAGGRDRIGTRYGLRRELLLSGNKLVPVGPSDAIPEDDSAESAEDDVGSDDSDDDAALGTSLVRGRSVTSSLAAPAHRHRPSCFSR